MAGSGIPNSGLLSSIQCLKKATHKLPLSTPEGTADGIVYRNFRTKPSEIEGSIFEKIDQAYTRCFSQNPSSGFTPLDNVLRGRFGMNVVIRFFEGCALSPKMDSGAIHLTELKVKQLTDLVYSRIQSLPKDPPSNPSKRKRGVRTGQQSQKLASKTQPPALDDEDNDSDFEPQSAPESYGSNSEDIDDAPKPEESKEFSQIQQAQTTFELESQSSIRKRRKISGGETNATREGESEEDDTRQEKKPGKKRGPQGIARQWAFSNYEAPNPAHHPDTAKPIWLFKCKHCDSIRQFQRTDGCLEFSKEPQHISATNLVAHLNSCRRLPVEHKLKAVTARLNRPPEILTPAQASVASLFRLSCPTPVPMPLAISNTTFRSTLIQGVIWDNYPLTFGEGRGMQQVFALTSPNIKLPSHQTMRTDLEKLYDVLRNRVLYLLKSQDSRFVITSDAWTSKSFAYSLGGVVITFIDRNWTMQEFVLDVVHLDADHTGAGMGRRIFKSLDCMGAAGNIIASVTDNASNNRTMNAEISKWIREKYEVSLRADSMSVICLAHALHLICGAIFVKLKAMDCIESDDMYAIVKSFDEGEIIENSAEVLEEEERLREQDNTSSNPKSTNEFEDDLSDMDVEEQPEASANPQPNVVSQDSNPNGSLNRVQKVHEIAVHVTSSAKRRKRMREIIRALKLEPRAVIKSVKVRWNSVLAEVRRALLLKQAFNQYVATLDEGKTGKSQSIARALKKKLTIRDEEWDMLLELVKILEYCPHMRYYAQNWSSPRRAWPLYGSQDIFGVFDALSAGKAKLDEYFDMAKENNLTVITSALHPGMRLSYFEDVGKCGHSGPILARRARELLEYLYEDYKLVQPDSTTSFVARSTEPAASSTPDEGWFDSLLKITSGGTSTGSISSQELRDYFDGRYQYNGGDILLWWKENEDCFPILSRIARDFLAIPATSVSVERLFSRCKLVMSDYRNMSVETAQRIITCQQWLEAGLGTDLPDFLSNN